LDQKFPPDFCTLDGIKEIRFFQKIGFLALASKSAKKKPQNRYGIKEIRFFKKSDF
jgi:hypothetical protein